MDNLIRGALTAALLGGLGYGIWILATVEIPEGNAEYLWTAMGVIGTLATQATTWWFGSSKGSADKTSLLNGGGHA